MSLLWWKLKLEQKPWNSAFWKAHLNISIFFLYSVHGALVTTQVQMAPKNAQGRICESGILGIKVHKTCKPRQHCLLKLGRTGGRQQEAPSLPIWTPDGCRECLQSWAEFTFSSAFASLMQLTTLSSHLHHSLGEHEELARRHYIFQDTGSHLVGDSPNGTPVLRKS